MRKHKLTLYDCDRCMFTYKKAQLRKQRGMLLCDSCFDSVLEIEPVSLRLYSPRANSTTIAAVTSPTIFTITATGGVGTLYNSQVATRQGVSHSYVMYVKGSPTPSISANPQIVAGKAGDILTLIGTSDTNLVQIGVGRGTDVATTFNLKNGCAISFTYNTVSAVWHETSRTVGGV